MGKRAMALGRWDWLRVAGWGFLFLKDSTGLLGIWNRKEVGLIDYLLQEWIWIDQTKEGTIT